MVPCPEHLPEVQRRFEAAMRDPHIAELYGRVIAGELRALDEFIKYICGHKT
jgi:beta-glucosidase-like glycosyl hydrolase